MTGAIVLVGFGLQIAGVIISSWGFWTTWREFAPPGGRFLGWLMHPVRDAVGAAARKVEFALRRLFRRPRPITGYASVGGRLNLSGGLGRVRIGYGDLPSDSAAALAELHRRTKQLMEKVSAVDERLAQETGERESGVKALQTDVDARFGRVEAMGQRIAIGGIRAQTLGLTLIGLGLILQMWAFWTEWGLTP
jgi:hypothetical protein